MTAENKPNRNLATELLVTGTKLVASVTADILTEIAARRAEEYRNAAVRRALATSGESSGPTRAANMVADIIEQKIGPQAGSAVRDVFTGTTNDARTLGTLGRRIICS